MKTNKIRVSLDKGNTSEYIKWFDHDYGALFSLTVSKVFIIFRLRGPPKSLVPKSMDSAINLLHNTSFLCCFFMVPLVGLRLLYYVTFLYQLQPLQKSFVTDSRLRILLSCYGLSSLVLRMHHITVSFIWVYIFGHYCLIIHFNNSHATFLTRGLSHRTRSLLPSPEDSITSPSQAPLLGTKKRKKKDNSHATYRHSIKSIRKGRCWQALVESYLE